LDCSAIYADLSILFAVEHVVLNVIHSFQVVRGWKLGKIAKNLGQGQKGNSYNLFIFVYVLEEHKVHGIHNKKLFLAAGSKKN